MTISLPIIGKYGWGAALNAALSELDSRTEDLDLDTGRLSEAGLSATIAAELTTTTRVDMNEIVWPQGLVAFFPLTEEYMTPEGDALSVGGIQQFVAKKVSGTVSFDALRAGPLGPALNFGGPASPNCWVIGGIEPDADDIGALDLSDPDTGFTVFSWTLPEDNWSDMAFRHGSHVESGPRAARQYADYYNGYGYGGLFRNSPHLGAQDGPTPGMPWNLDFPSSARRYHSRWTFAVGTYDNEKMVAYVDGVADTYLHYTDPAPGGGYTQRVDISKNPYFPIYGTKGINPSTAKKGYSIGGALHGGTPYTVVNSMKGLGQAFGVFNRALTPEEVWSLNMQFVALFKRTAGAEKPLVLFDYHSGTATGPIPTAELGWKTIAGPYAEDKSRDTITPGYRLSAPTVATSHMTRNPDTFPAVSWFPLDGVRSPHIRRVTFDLNSTLAADSQRFIIKIDGVWYASETVFDTTVEHAIAADWSGAETKTALIDLAEGNWRNLAFTDSATGQAYTPTFENLCARPSGEAGWTNWLKLGSNGLVLSETETVTAPKVGTKARRYTVTTAASGASATIFETYAGLGFAAGADISCGVYVRPSVTTKMVCTPIIATPGDAILGQVTGAVVDCPANVWTFVGYQGASLATGTKAYIRIVNSSTGVLLANGVTIDADAAILVQGMNYPPDIYFDGDSPGATWAGTPHATKSSKTYNIVGSPAITLGGAALTTRIQAGELEAIGFYSPGGSGTHRIKNVKLWRKAA